VAVPADHEPLSGSSSGSAGADESCDRIADEEGADEPIAPAAAVPAQVSRLDLERAIKMLPNGARAAFLLHDVEGFEHREIAQILGISEGTSKSQVHKARMKLRAILSR
jgi:RNA polymerase sigma-70 factor (ECF subfamily)